MSHEFDKRGVLLLSGGIDSTFMLGLAKIYKWEMVTLFVDYGQRPRNAEWGCAHMVADRYGCELLCSFVDLPLGASPLLTTGSQVVTKTLAEIAEQEQSEFYVPGRNAILLSIAASFAEARGIKSVWIGANIDDQAGFKDCRRDFFDALEPALGVKIKSPLIEMPKREIVRAGAKLKCPFILTSSCYYAADSIAEQCGRCPACLIRDEAFDEAGVPRC